MFKTLFGDVQAGRLLRLPYLGYSLLLSVLMIVVGLSPALGTFLAGVVLANSEYRHELEASIEPFKGLLLGLFFISVGMSVDLGLVVSEPVRIAAIVAGLLPIMLGSGTGSEVMRRIAAPMVGGMVSATVLTLVVVPVIYGIWKGWRLSDDDTESTEITP